MEFGILGSVEVQREDGPVRLGGPKPRALLAMLLLHANRPVSRDRLIDGLWGERPPATAEHTLDDYVSRLRKVLGADRIERRAPGYAIRVQSEELDLERFEQLVARGRAALASGAAGEAAGLLRSALALWRGPALADVLDAPFAASEAERLEDQRLSALEDRLGAELDAGGGPDLIVDLERLVREQPMRERLLGQLMLALYRAGRQAEALAAFQAGRRRLAEELGLEPGPQLRVLEQQILEHDSRLALPPPRPLGRGQSGGRSRRGMIAVVSSAAVVGVGVVGGLVLGIGGTSGSTPATAIGNRLVAISSSASMSAPGVSLAGAPAAMASGAGSIWIAAPDASAVLRADRVSGRVVDRIPLPDQPAKIAVGGGAVWVASALGRTISRIDPRSGTISQTIRLGITPSAIAFGRRELWVADPTDKALLRIAPASGIVRQTLSLRSRPSAVAAGGGAVWVASNDAGTVTHIDARSNAPVATIAVGQAPTAIAIAHGSLWVANSLDGTVSRIDPQTAQVQATIPTGSGPSDVVAAQGSVWVANRYSRTVSRIDPLRTAVTATVALDGEPAALAVAAGKVWVGSRGRAEHRGGTVVMLTAHQFLSMDPQVDYERPPAQYLGLAYDGLVAYNQTDGPDGLQLVPDLALSLPVPTDGGRSYVFRLRPGLRYADGRPVRASDIARAARRMFRVNSPGISSFAGLVGGRTCQHRPRSCTLPRGVIADDATRTISFHLEAADPEFLQKLAIGVLVPIPRGTPMHDVGSTPIPGTGPYKIAAFGRREVRFVRNPRFREWSHAAQPQGNPDEIAWRFDLTASERIDAITHGRADYTDEPPAQLGKLARLTTLHLHSNAFPVTFFLQLNTRRPPFSDVRARRALNYAVDRAVIARAYGGALAATSTCQVLPPGVPGYRRYCPYTADPRRDGRWRAPDLPRARALVKASGTRGARVTLWSVSDTATPEPGVRYVAALLRRLGYRASVRVITGERLAHVPASFRWRMQMLPIVFGPDYPSPFGFFSTFLSCHGVFSWRQFCDPRLDRQMGRAQSLGLAHPRRSARLWAQLDREIVDRAIWLPLLNERIVDLVSTRLRGYQNSPIYHFLPSQAWLQDAR